MRKFLKKIYDNYQLGYYILNPILVLVNFLKNRIFSDEYYLKKKFRRAFKRDINLEAPKTLNEKIIWLKLNDRTDLHTQCADKFAVREYVKQQIGEAYLVPLYLTTLNPKEVVPEKLPSIPVIIKTNHDSGGGIFVYDKSKTNWKHVQESLRRRMKKNYYWRTKEWQYKNIIPRIVVEKLLITSKGGIPNDYKIHCFNGRARMIQVDIDRDTDHHHRNWYNTKWEREPYKWSSPKGKGIWTDPSEEDVAKPKTLEKMIELSEKIAEKFDYVRVDWYDVDGSLFFGEITFHHDGGTKPILPEEWDFKLGSELTLSPLAK